MSTAAAPAFATEADELEYVIPVLDTFYEVGDPCIHPVTGKLVSDDAYDAMKKRLKSLRPDSTVFLTVTTSRAYSGQAVVKHDPPLTSIEKASGPQREEELAGWLALVARTLGYADVAGKVVVSFKRDGVACALYYAKGKLVAAGLRPRDGVYGEDVLANVRHVSGVREELPYPITCSIRGELECPISVFEAIRDDWRNPAYGLDREPANPRNYTSGSIRQFKDTAVTGSRKLRFVGYAVESLTFPPGYRGREPRTRRELARWVKIDLGVDFVRVEPYQGVADLERLEAIAARKPMPAGEPLPTIDYEVDGAVLAVDDLEDYEQMGRHGDRATGDPRGALAYKFRDEVAETVYEGCAWSTARTGTLTPVAQFSRPLRLAGTNVVNCSMHNIAFAVRNEILPGVRIEVIKSGKIIPKVVTVVHPDGRRVDTDSTAQVKVTRAQAEAYPHPAECPDCGHPTHLQEGQEGMWDLVCRNLVCPAQVASTFVFFLSTIGVRGVGDSQIKRLLAAGKLKTLADLYRLGQADLESVGLSERQSTLALAAIHMVEAPAKVKDNAQLRGMVAAAAGRKKPVPAWQVFAALGVPTAGRQAGKVLIEHFRSFDRLLDATPDELVLVGDIGRKTAQVIAGYFAENRGLVRDILQYLEPQLPRSGRLTGRVFCLSGKVDKGRLERAIEAEGGTCTGNVSKKVHYLVAGEGSGLKTEAALVLQRANHPIRIIDADELEKMLA